jgi:hypothetical protein
MVVSESWEDDIEVALLRFHESQLQDKLRTRACRHAHNHACKGVWLRPHALTSNVSAAPKHFLTLKSSEELAGTTSDVKACTLLESLYAAGRNRDLWQCEHLHVLCVEGSPACFLHAPACVQPIINAREQSARVATLPQLRR